MIPVIPPDYDGPINIWIRLAAIFRYDNEIPSSYLINPTQYSLLVSHPANSARLEISQRRLTAFVNEPTMVLVEIGWANVADIGNSGQRGMKP